jgi:hypothetical protein
MKANKRYTQNEKNFTNNLEFLLKNQKNTKDEKLNKLWEESLKFTIPRPM